MCVQFVAESDVVMFDTAAAFVALVVNDAARGE
jgi:hypothetical protein